MSIWARVFATGYDLVMAGPEKAGLAAHRERLLATVAGRVLELGAGTGANLPFYGGRVSEIVLAEPEKAMVRRLERKLQGYRIPARVVRAAAEQVPVASGTCDVVVCTLVLCTVADPARALAEVRRVLKTSGRVVFMEHVRSDDPELARWQDRLRRPWGWLGHGCQCNRPTLATIGSAGFAIADVSHDRLRRMPRVVAPLVVGSAMPTS